MRAALADREGSVEVGGVELAYEVYGSGEPTILLLPTWTIIHTRFWKMQIPYLARHYRVITFDGLGNGRSERTTDPSAYSADAYAAGAAAVLAACEVGRAFVVGLSLGAAYGSVLAATNPDLVAGLVMVGPSIPVTPPAPERALIEERFMAPLPRGARGWEKYNLAYWHHDYADFSRFFFEQCFSEAHSTKPIEDCVGWAQGAGPEILEAEAMTSDRSMQDWVTLLGSLECPVLVIHGDEDRISPHERGLRIAEETNGTIVSLAGSGHVPNVRDPVKVNLAIRRFVEENAA